MRFTEIPKDSSKYEESVNTTRTDCDRLLNEFADKVQGRPNATFGRFVEVWQQLHYAEIHFLHVVAQNARNRPSVVVEFGRRRNFQMFFSQFQDLFLSTVEGDLRRLGALYALLALWHTQPFNPKEYYRIGEVQLRQYLRFAKELDRKLNASASQAMWVLHYLTTKAQCFHYVSGLKVTPKTPQQSQTAGTEVPRGDETGSRVPWTTHNPHRPRFIIRRPSREYKGKMKTLMQGLRTIAFSSPQLDAGDEGNMQTPSTGHSTAETSSNQATNRSVQNGVPASYQSSPNVPVTQQNSWNLIEQVLQSDSGTSLPKATSVRNDDDENLAALLALSRSISAPSNIFDESTDLVANAKEPKRRKRSKLESQALRELAKATSLSKKIEISALYQIKPAASKVKVDVLLQETTLFMEELSARYTSK